MQCPKCGNTNLQIITETETKGKDFSVTKGCCGAVLFGWIGILCGACGTYRELITLYKKTSFRHLMASEYFTEFHTFNP